MTMRVMPFLSGGGRLLPLTAMVLAMATDVHAQAVADTFLITLQRTACFGTCPAYKVSIESDGRVTYDGSQFVRVTGRQETRIPVSAVVGLVETVNRIGFFKLEDTYAAPITDLPTTTVTVTSGGRTKRVVDYVGAPKELRELERQIDDVAGTRRWIRIDVAVLNELVAKGPAPSREQLDKWLLDAIRHEDLDVAKALIALGANPNSVIGSGSRPLLGTAPSGAAVKLLVAAGADPFVVTRGGETLLEDVVRYASPDVAIALLDAGVPASPKVLVRAACNGHLALVTRLLRAGADPTVKLEGMTALECARGYKKSGRQISELLGDPPDPYQDYEGTVAALERAVAERKPR
jgi:hypothetical protein